MQTNRSTPELTAFLRRALSVALCVTVAVVGFASISLGDDVVTPLPKPRMQSGLSVEEALSSRRSVRSFDAAAKLTLSNVSQLLWAAQGITNDRGFRTAPSAGALFPVEIYMVAGAVTGLAPGTYHYDSKLHRLLRVAKGDVRRDLAKASGGQDWMIDAPVVLILAANYDRTARKYGARAARYVQMEIGHASQNVYLQSESLGLGTCLVGAFSDASIKTLLDLPESFAPVGLMPIGRPRGP